MAAPMVRQILAQRARYSLMFSSYRNAFSSTCNHLQQQEKGELRNNEYFDKYAGKLKKAQSLDPDRFQSKLEDLKESKQSKWKDEQQPMKPAKSKKAQPRLLKQSQGAAETQGLDSIMNIDLIKDLSSEEIHKIWTQHHIKKDCISAVIPSKVYDKIYQTSKENPLFIYPLPKKTGYEFFFAQFDNHNCYFTSLINYQAYQENAPILLSLKHFTELQQDKSVVLMRGEIDTELMLVQDAQFLANQLQLYYATDDPRRLDLLDTFNHRQDQFKHMDLTAQLERSTLELPTASNMEKGL